jgi:hypothetical protein
VDRVTPARVAPRMLARVAPHTTALADHVIEDLEDPSTTVLEELPITALAGQSMTAQGDLAIRVLEGPPITAQAGHAMTAPEDLAIRVPGGTERTVPRCARSASEPSMRGERAVPSRFGRLWPSPPGEESQANPRVRA